MFENWWPWILGNQEGLKNIEDNIVSAFRSTSAVTAQSASKAPTLAALGVAARALANSLAPYKLVSTSVANIAVGYLDARLMI
jgi:hypothetical protein